MAKLRIKAALSVFFRSARLVPALALLIPLAFTACGKKEAPTPDFSDKVFIWESVDASVNDLGCISVYGSVLGEKDNLNFIALELQVYDESCAGCPFVAEEIYRVNAADDLWESPGSEKFRFAYCPALRSYAYRWRVQGHNVYTSQLAILSPVRLVSSVMNLEED